MQVSVAQSLCGPGRFIGRRAREHPYGFFGIGDEAYPCTPWLQSAWFEGDVQIGDLVQVELVEAGPNSLAGMLRETVAA